MSQGRSPSGVASLRARFESNSSDKTPPPSRGRSPAGSVASDSSRPLSKVRTSFVVVEPSGHMASTLEVPKTGPTTFDGSQDSKSENPMGTPPKANGLPSTTGISGQQGSSEITHAADSKPGKGDADEEAIPAESGEEGLGSILKGSPFEGDVGDEATTQKEHTEHSTSALPASKQSPALTRTDSTASKEGSNETKPTAKPSNITVPNSQPPQKSTGSSNSSTKATVNGNTKEPADPKMASMKAPGAIRTQNLPHGPGKAAKAPSKDDGASKKSINSPSTPRTPTSSTSAAPKASSQPAKPLKASVALSATAKPSQGHSTQSKGPAKSSVDRVASKGAETAKAATKPPTSKSASSHPTSTKPHAAATKPRPKSPTKPVKLPAAATAPTASSAAKHDEGGAAPPQARSPGRQSSVSTATKGPAGSLSKPTRPVRASLPAHSKPADKSKSKPRTSMASTGASSGSFLERMMRPTQSSAQKTHDKVEPKSPPRKTSAPKPKRKSGDIDASKVDDRELEQAPAQHPEADQHEAPEAADAHAVPLTDPTAAKSDEAAKEIEGAAPATSTTKPKEPQAVDVAQ